MEFGRFDVLFGILIGVVSSGAATVIDKDLIGSTNRLLKFTIILFLVFGIYLVLAFIYRKFIIHAKGSVYYNTNISASIFKLPDIFIPGIFRRCYRNIFLVGPNQNFLLNISHNADNFYKLVQSLSDKNKVSVLISNLKSDTIKYMYSNVSAKDFNREASEILNSIRNIDNYIKNNFGEKKLQQIKDNRLLEIKCVDLWLDSFCFVNGDESNAKGYVMLVTKNVAGGSRPIYYFSKKYQQELFNSYYQTYKYNVYEDAELLWPL